MPREPSQPDIITSKLSRRLVFFLAACSLLIPLYAATWHSSSEGTSNYVQRRFGRLADVLTQAFILFALLFFLAVLFPDDLESPQARKYIGTMLFVSDLSDSYAAHAHAHALQLSRASVVATFDEVVCLYVQYAISLFFWLWGVVYPTMTFFCLHNSWCRLRTGMVVDAAVFLFGIAVLYAHGETRYPPGDAPLAAAFGRPAVALVGAAFVTPANRRRLAVWAEGAGLFHIRLSLEELSRDDNVRRMLSRVGLGAPVACGNSAASTASTAPSAPASRPAPRSVSRSRGSSSTPSRIPPSHHTAKLSDGAVLEAVAPGATAPLGVTRRPARAWGSPARARSE